MRPEILVQLELFVGSGDGLSPTQLRASDGISARVRINASAINLYEAAGCEWGHRSGFDGTCRSAGAENIIALHLPAIPAETHRFMTILKSHDRRVDMKMRRFEITEGGIRSDDDYARTKSILRDISSQGPPMLSADLKLTRE